MRKVLWISYPFDEFDREGIDPSKIVCFSDALSRYSYLVSRGWVKPATDEVSALVEELYRLIRRFEQLFPGRHFTPDGHLVGSIGEVIAAHRLCRASGTGRMHCCWC